MFQILDYTQAILANVTNRTENHDEVEVPAVSLGIELTGPNTLLDSIDPTLRHTLYRAKDDEPTLPGVEESTPVLRCNSIERVLLPTVHEGWRLFIDDSIDPGAPIEFALCKVDKFTVEPLQGGMIVLRFRIGTADVNGYKLGVLGMHTKQSVFLQLLKPEERAEAIDGTVGHPGAQPGAAAPTAESMFAGLEDAAPSTRTARGREATKKALAEGLAAHQGGSNG